MIAFLTAVRVPVSRSAKTKGVNVSSSGSGPIRPVYPIHPSSSSNQIVYTGRIGPEPLDETFTPFVFADRLTGTRTAVKKAIMDQRRVAGVGNIYANEALFDARLN